MWEESSVGGVWCGKRVVEKVEVINLVQPNLLIYTTVTA